MRRPVVLVAIVAIGGCGEDAAAPMPDAAPAGHPSIEGTPVSSFETTSCSTGTVLELSRQIAEETDCLMPGQLVKFDVVAGLQITGSAVLPYLGADARADLYTGAAMAGATPMQITSAFRTVVQQYLLFRWFQLGRCSITAAADPGRSNHESGRALDIGNYTAFITILGNHGWAHDVPGDPVHFDHLASADLRGTDVLAFQRLWNRNAPEDLIAEDGDFGPATEDRVKRAPAEGFGIGATCATRRRFEVATPDIAVLPGSFETD
ncbi:hypothetical protein BH11MYX3_BH11MYX3_08340 [soil metagenome]